MTVNFLLPRAWRVSIVCIKSCQQASQRIAWYRFLADKALVSWRIVSPFYPFVHCGLNGMYSAPYLRQSILVSAYETPDTRSLYNSLKNVSGKMRTEKRYSPIEVPAGIDQVYYAVILFTDSIMVYNCTELPSFRLYQSCQWTREEISLFHNASLAHCAQVCGTEHKHDYIYPIIIWLHPHPKLLSEASWCDIYGIIRVSWVFFSHPALFDLIRFPLDTQQVLIYHAPVSPSSIPLHLSYSSRNDSISSADTKFAAAAMLYSTLHLTIHRFTPSFWVFLSWMMKWKVEMWLVGLSIQSTTGLGWKELQVVKLLESWFKQCNVLRSLAISAQVADRRPACSVSCAIRNFALTYTCRL